MTFNILNIANSFPTTFSLSLTLSSFHQPNMNSFSSKKICELYYLNKIQAGGPTNLSLEHGALKSNGHWWEPAPFLIINEKTRPGGDGRKTNLWCTPIQESKLPKLFTCLCWFPILCKFGMMPLHTVSQPNFQIFQNLIRLIGYTNK